MPSIRRFYIRSIRRQVGASPIWPVSVKYKLGDYGYYLRGTGKFSVRGNVFDKFSIDTNQIVRTGDVELYNIIHSSNTSKNDFRAILDVESHGGELDIAFENGRSYLFHLFKAKPGD